MITYHKGIGGIRTAYSVEEAAQFEKDGYKLVDLRKWAKEHDKAEEKPKRTRRSKKQIEADKQAEE